MTSAWKKIFWPTHEHSKREDKKNRWFFSVCVLTCAHCIHILLLFCFSRCTHNIASMHFSVVVALCMHTALKCIWMGIFSMQTPTRCTEKPHPMTESDWLMIVTRMKNKNVYKKREKKVQINYVNIRFFLIM